MDARDPEGLSSEHREAGRAGKSVQPPAYDNRRCDLIGEEKSRGWRHTGKLGEVSTGIMGRTGHLLVLGADRQPLVGVSDSLMAAKRPLGNGIKACRILGQVLPPAFRIPDLKMVPHTKQHHLAFEFSESTQPLRNENPAGPVNIH